MSGSPVLTQDYYQLPRLPSTFSWILRYYVPEIVKIFRINQCLATACNTRRASRMMPLNGSIRMRKRAEKRGLPGAGLRASSVRDVRGQSIVRSVGVNFYNADSAAIR